MKHSWIKMLVSFGLGGLFLTTAWAQESLFLEPVKENPFKSFQDNLPQFSYQVPLAGEDFEHYLNFYALDFPDVTHYAGLIQTRVGHIFTHVFQPQLPPPKQSAGVVVALHGYFVHTGQQKYLIEALLKANYTVISLDLPGHGLSTGAKASIDDFSEYAQMLDELSPPFQAHFTGPFYLVGHSTGAAGVWEYLLTHPNHTYKKAVLAAPLVRSYLWELSAAGFYLGNAWLKEVPRIMKPTTSDPSFLALTRRDPLQYPGTPTRWVESLIRWNDHHIPHLPPSQTKVLILQGQQDTVVDWAYNIPYLQKKFPHSEVHWFPDARHDILWERSDIRNQVFEDIISYFK